MNMKERRQQKLQLTWLGWFQKHTHVGEGVSFHHCMHSSLGCSSNGGCFDQSKSQVTMELLIKAIGNPGRWEAFFLAKTKFL